MSEELINSQINEIFSLLDKSYPDAKTELNYQNNYNLLIAVILSAQSTDKKVNKVTEILFEKANKADEMLNLTSHKLREIIFSVGLSNSKANNIIKLSEILVKNYNGEVPTSFEELISLPGVGRKTANVILNCLFGGENIGVDTHVKRVSNRLGLVSSPKLLEIEKILLKKIPKKWLNKAHNLMVLHGRYICIARKPKCDLCILTTYCKYFQNNFPA